MKALAAALLLALPRLAAPARADDGDPSGQPRGAAVDADRNEAVADMRRQLEGDEGLQEALVERVLRSKIAGVISREDDPAKKAADVRAWVKADLGGAAEIALGLGKDDEEGSHRFESNLVKSLSLTTYSRNNTGRGAYGVLKDAAKKSKTVKGAEQDVSDEQRREMLKNLFEGKGSMSEKVVEGGAPDGKAASADTPASAALATSFYDRLSAGNIRGYSPQLLALQSALNTRRPPGAPALIETGKLDHATLSYPAYGLRFDLGNLDERLRRDRIVALANAAGVQLTPRDLQDPNIEAKLAAKLPASAKLSKRFESRKALLEKARAALGDFEGAADKSKDPAKITKGLLVELSGRQREAARWVTAAALEEELGRIELEEGFLTPELLAAIDAVPAPKTVIESYKRRGDAYKARIDKLKDNAQKALDALQSDAWLSRLAEIEKMMGENQGLRRNLSRDISDFRLVPFRVAEAVLKQPRWREIVDDLLVKYAASTSYGRGVAARRGKLSRFLSIFGQIASGDLEGAHLSLVNAEGARR